jgi:hypothetical protein
MLQVSSLVILLMAALPGGGVTPASQGPGAAQPKMNPLDKIVCRTEEGLGSRLNRSKVCMTVREWKEQAEGSREAAEKMQQQNQGIMPSG